MCKGGEDKPSTLLQNQKGHHLHSMLS